MNCYRLYCPNSFSQGRKIINALSMLAGRERPVLSCYLPLLDPLIRFDLFSVYAECGVDIVEVGVPTTDAWMDGSVVSDSMQRIIEAGLGQADIAHKLMELRQKHSDMGVVIMGYENMRIGELMLTGKPDFDAVLRIGTADEEEAQTLQRISAQHHVDSICFVSDAMTADEITRASQATAYIMLQANAGKTGVRSSLNENNREKIECLKAAGVKIPILLGFGISNAEQAAAALAMGADGVIIGSACLLYALEGEVSLRNFLYSIREALDAKCA